MLCFIFANHVDRIEAPLSPPGLLAMQTELRRPRPPQIASLIGADPKEIIFTSGATESNNLAIKGVASFYKDRKKHIVTTQTDHKCVLDSCRCDT